MKMHTTQSLYEASYFLARGFKLISKDSSGQKVALLFENSPELNQAVIDYYNGAGKASAKALFDAYRSLKDMVFQR